MSEPIEVSAQIASMTVASRASVATEHAGRYVQQLCKHFSHKRPVTASEQSGRIVFTTGECRLKADPGLLAIEVIAPAEAEMAQLQDVVVRHLVRFAFREDLAVEWQNVPGERGQ